MQGQRIDERIVYTATEAAELLKIRENALYRLLRSGALIARKTNNNNGYWRILGGNIIKYLNNE